MKVLLVNGSPNVKGTCKFALDVICERLNVEGIETEVFEIGTKGIPGCIGCNLCKTTGYCHIYDDKVNEFINKCESADGFIFASPVYYASPNGTLLAFMDRVFYAGKHELFTLKPAASVLAARRAGTTASFDVLNKYYTINEMPIISSCYWNNIHGNSYEEAKEDLEGIRIMKTLANNMAYYLKMQKIANENGLKKPEKEARVLTNFIR